MPPVSDWSVPFTLTSPYGDLAINTEIPGLGLYLFRPQGCQMSVEVRATVDNVPQSDGSILHRRFMTGMTAPLVIQLWADFHTIACDEQLEEMLEELTKHLRALLNAGDNEGRLAWTPAGASDRKMLDDIRLFVYPLATIAQGQAGAIEVSATIDSEYPYAQNLTEQMPNAVTNGSSAALVNAGTADYFPVFKVYGTGHGTNPTSAFTLTNAATTLQIKYDATLPGADPIGVGDYVEINTFRNTAFLNGNGANMKAGISELETEFWPLIVGSNSVSITGGDVDILWANGWG